MIVTRVIQRLSVLLRSGRQNYYLPVPFSKCHLSLLNINIPLPSGPHQYHCKGVCSAVQSCHSSRFPTIKTNPYSTSAADNKQPPKLWTVLEPELEEYLIPRKLAVSPLESWLSLRYSLPPLLEAPMPLEEGKLMDEAVVLPSSALPILEDQENPTPLSCKNVLEIRRRKMNRHKYKKLMKRTKFLRRRVMERRQKRKQVSQ